MSKQHEQWIEANAPACQRGMCQSATEAMLNVFPELRRVRGHYVSSKGRAPHWWLEDADGNVIDPTAAQFADPAGDYVEFTGPEPIGKCYNCGEYYFESPCSGVCSAVCADAYVDYLQAEVSR